MENQTIAQHFISKGELRCNSIPDKSQIYAFKVIGDDLHLLAVPTQKPIKTLARQDYFFTLKKEIEYFDFEKTLQKIRR